MQGNLSEIDIRSILQLIELGQRTGELCVESYPAPLPPLASGRRYAAHEQQTSWSQPGRFWFVFFVQGQIVYTASTDTSLSRLQDYLRRYRLEQRLEPRSLSSSEASINAPEYGHLWRLLEDHLLSPAQGRAIIRSMVHETLFDLLSLHQGSFIFEQGPPLSPQLTALETAPLVTKIMTQVQEWKLLHPLVQSPDQCPLVVNDAALQASVSRRTMAALDRYLDSQTSIRQIARYLGRDILTVARAIYPYAQQGAIQLVFPESLARSPQATPPNHPWDLTGVAEAPLDPEPPKVVCVDDSVTLGKTVEAILGQNGYTAIALDEPLAALSQVFSLNPDLILCDIAMPDLDGYELCAMLRRSTRFRQTPIVMLTGKDGFIDRVRAKMVGATNYLTKPFGASELLMLVEKYIGPGRSHPTEAAEQTAHSAKDGVESERAAQTSSSSMLID